MIPKFVDKNWWIVIGNPRGHGKTNLLKEFGSGRKDGSVLFTDFSTVRRASDVDALMSATIAPLFIDGYPLIIRVGM